MLFIVLFVSLLIPFDGARASEDSLYDFVWLDPDKEVYVLQNKLFQKEHSWYLEAGYLMNTTSKFQDTSGFVGKLGYYFHEEWGVEAFYNHYVNEDNDDLRNIQIINEQSPYIRRLNSSYGLLAIWSPFYGKINTFNKIFYFDWSFGAGIGQVDAEDNLETSLLSISGTPVAEVFEKKSYTGGILKTKVKLHLSEDVFLGLEYMRTHYMAPSPKDPKTDKLRTNADIIFSVGYSI